MKNIIVLFCLFFTIYTFAQSSDTLSTASGLKYIIVATGKGTKAVTGKAVEVHYIGSLTSGKEFDNSYKRGTPIGFELGKGQVIKGWDEGIALMRVGDKLKLIIPPDLAYGDKGAGDVIPANSTLIFDVELMSVYKSIVDTMMQVVLNRNVKSAIELYHDIKDDYEKDYNFKESELNTLGYQLLQAGLKKDAIEILKLNVEQFPESFNVYDSLGEAYMLNGDTKLAIKNYKKSLALNPNNDNAKKMLEQLNKK